MPPILPVYDPTNTIINQACDQERKARITAIDAAWKYYEGDHKKQLKVRPDRPDFNVILNLAGKAIDTMVAFIGVPRFEVAGGFIREADDSGFGRATRKSREQEAVEAFWKQNRLDKKMVDIALSGFLAGHTFLRLIPQAPLPRIALLDPRFCVACWDMSDVERLLFYRMTWQMGDAQTSLGQKPPQV